MPSQARFSFFWLPNVYANGLGAMCAFTYLMNNLFQGVVKWYDADKRFGFISPNDGGQDMFFAARHIVGRGYRHLNEGQAVVYTVEMGEQGPQAATVQPV